MICTCRGHVTGGARGTGARVVQLGVVQVIGTAVIVNSPGYEYLAVGEQSGGMRNTGRGQAAGWAEDTCGRVVQFGTALGTAAAIPPGDERLAVGEWGGGVLSSSHSHASGAAEGAGSRIVQFCAFQVVETIAIDIIISSCDEHLAVAEQNGGVLTSCRHAADGDGAEGAAGRVVQFGATQGSVSVY